MTAPHAPFPSLAEQIPADIRALMTEGSDAHRDHEYREAAGAYREAAHLAEARLGNVAAPEDAYPLTFAMGESERDWAAALGQDGRARSLATAVDHAHEAVAGHTTLLEQLLTGGNDATHPHVAEARNSLDLDHTILGRLSLQQLIRRERATGRPVDRTLAAYRDSSLRDVLMRRDGRPLPTQTDVNTRWLYALRETLYGSTAMGRRHARHAMRVGRHSEAVDDPSSNPDLSPNQRRAARTRAVVRGAGVLATSLVAGNNLRQDTRIGRMRRNVALAMAESLIVGPRRARQLQRR